MTPPIPVGIVEGFYGRPWSHEDRVSIIHFMGERGMNNYCYAPKDDPYHRDKWREPYPSQLFASILVLQTECAKAGVNFCFAISPGLTIEYSNPKEFETLAAKLRPFFDAGVRHFALFLDDVPAELKHAADRARYANFGEAHADLANRLKAELKNWDTGCSLVFCPTEYYLNERTPYLKSLAAGIDRDIPIVWTGMGVTSQFVTPQNLLRIRATTGGKPFLWDNYPVNDYATGHLFMGPLMHRSPTMPQHLSGYWSNPMNEAEASKIPLWTIADYFKHPAEYNPAKSWDDAIRGVGGLAAYPHLRLLCDLTGGSFLTQEEGAALSLAAADWLAQPQSTTATEALRARVKEMVDLDENLKRTLENRRLYVELRPTLKKLRRNAQSLSLALDLIAEPPDSARASELRAELAAGLKAADTRDTSPASMSPVTASAEEWEALMLDDDRLTTADAADPTFALLQGEIRRMDLVRRGGLRFEVSCTAPEFQGNCAEFALDPDPDSFYWSNRPFRRDDFFLVEFRDAQATGTTITVKMGSKDRPDDFIGNGKLQISDNGTSWTDVAKLDKREVAATAEKEFRYLRLTCAADQEKWVVVREITLAAPRRD